MKEMQRSSILHITHVCDHADAVISAFDFEYVRDYFFEPAKVNGRGYAPLQ